MPPPPTVIATMSGSTHAPPPLLPPTATTRTEVAPAAGTTKVPLDVKLYGLGVSGPLTQVVPSPSG